MPPPDPTDPAIEAAAKRAYEARYGYVLGLWDILSPTERESWLAVARAAQPPPKFCGTCRFWGSEKERLWHQNRTHRTCQAPVDVDLRLMHGTEIYPSADYGCVLHKSMEEKP